MKIIKAKNLYECLYIITTTQFYFGGLGFWKVGNNFKITKFTTFYSYGVIIIVTILLNYGLIQALYDLKDTKISTKISNLTLIIAVTEIIISNIIFIYANLTLLINRYKHIKLIEFLNLKDQQFINEFNVQMNYYKMTRKNLFILFIFPGYYIGAVLTLWWKFFDEYRLKFLKITLVFLFVTLSTPTIVYGATNLTDLICVRFRIIKKFLYPEYLKKFHNKPKLLEKRLQTLIDIYKDIFEIISRIDEVYGPAILLATLNEFLMSTFCAFFLLWKASEEISEENTNIIIGILFQLIPPLWKMAMSPLYSTLAINEVCIIYLITFVYMIF